MSDRIFPLPSVRAAASCPFLFEWTQLVDISKLGSNSKTKKFSYSFICGKGYSPPCGGEWLFVCSLRPFLSERTSAGFVVFRTVCRRICGVSPFMDFFGWSGDSAYARKPANENQALHRRNQKKPSKLTCKTNQYNGLSFM